MKIRTQFLLLTTGIVIIPVLVLGIIFLLEYRRMPERILVPVYAEITSVAKTEINRASWELIAKRISLKPSQVDYIILDSASTVLFSTDASIVQASVLSDADMVSMIRENPNKYLFQMDSSSGADDSAILVITRITREAHRPIDPIMKIFSTLLILLGAILAFSATMSVIIARAITKSVMILEESTRRIAAGELDLTVNAKGSNEITSLVISLNSMRLALKDEQIRRSRFIMGVSHDLKTPLALIKGYSEAIADGMADDPAMMKKSLGIIGSKVGQLEEMIDDLIGFVKLDTGEWRHNLQNRAIAPLLRTFVKRISADGTLLKRNLESSVELSDSVCAPIDERLFFRAIENITNNALRYTKEEGMVSIKAELAGAAVRISVTDNGPGIADEDLPHIFDLFYRGSNSRREKGMGLGLSVVKSVADSHGWEIKVDSKTGTGSTFTIVIPVSG